MFVVPITGEWGTTQHILYFSYSPSINDDTMELSKLQSKKQIHCSEHVEPLSAPDTFRYLLGKSLVHP